MTHQTVTVPVEPTREMWAAAGTAVCNLQRRGVGHHDAISEAVWAAMIAAASPPATAAPEGVEVERAKAWLAKQGVQTLHADHPAALINGLLRVLAALPQETEGWREIESRVDSLVSSLAPDQGEGASADFRTALEVQMLVRRLADDEGEVCPICDVEFISGTRCAIDVEMGTCHADCLEGSPVVDLDTGEPTDAPVFTFIYGSDEPLPSPPVVSEGK